MDFVATFISGFKIGKDGVQIGLVTFSTDVKIEYYLNEYHDLQTLLQKTSQVGYTHPGLTLTNLGMDTVREKVFSLSQGDRPNAKNILIIITDGESNLRTLTAISAKQLHASNVTVFSVGIGNTIDVQELISIASDPENVMTVGAFSNLQGIVDHLQQKLCTDCNAALPSDIVFLVDESGSVNGNPADINNTNFEKQLDFVATVISGFKIGKDGVQIGLVTFSTDVVIEYYLNQYHDLQTLQQKTRQVGYTHPGLTFTNYGLYEVKNKLFTPSRGDRSYAANILVVLTDGESNLKTPTAISASEVHASNITVFAIGIGNKTNIGELRIIASEPEHVLTVKDFGELQGIRGELMQKICKDNGGTNGNDTDTGAQVTELVLPGWFSYLEVGIISGVAILTIGAATCCCHKFCCAGKRRENDDDEEDEKKNAWKKDFREPMKRPISISV
ncbi:hypothetical protein FSP39_022875 [Pinctada imbricata]|uniref:VWFA domain-containing protein n=1 Tax=Pinctada imbricata TaxID=66713 RepID=A0AA88XJY8_PINIB|nr:hypothetical protein FSP39_022875 [Pinctada imbricata]